MFRNIRARGVAAVLSLVLCACGGDGGRADAPAPAGSAAEWFVDRAAETGLDFLHFNGMSGERFYPEIMAPGVGLLDYDNDGDLDVFVVQGQMLGRDRTVAQATYAPRGALKDRLYRNDLIVDGKDTRTLRFTDVTDASGIDLQTYGMGVVAGDIDNDGWVDIYRTSLNGGVMLRNNGNGTFSDVTARSGAANRGGWGVSAAFLDYDRDGWLDLYVGNYLIYSTDADIDCLSPTGQHDYCPPNSYRAQPDRLYRNRGGGVFEDVTTRALTGGAYGPALGVSTADVDNDGWIDIYVGNDGEPNQLWVNQKNGTFKDTAFLAGAAVNGAGNSEASMGIDAGDFDNDGDEDLFITNWLNQMNTLYVNTGGGLFEERKAASGLGAPSLAKTGFGTAWFDYDNDGWLDLFVANGSVSMIEAQLRANDPFPLKMQNQLYRNTRDGRFTDVSPAAGKALTVAGVGRGAAFGDVDNDGDTDILVSNAAGRLNLLINNVGNQARWVGVRLVGAGGRDMIGARVTLVRPDGSTLMRRARSDGSYASANDPRVIFGGIASADPVRVRVLWPDGSSEEFADVPVARWTTLRQGSGR